MGSSSRQDALEVEPLHEQLLQKLLPGALLMDYTHQQEPLLDVTAVLSLLCVTDAAQRIAKEQQEQQQQQRNSFDARMLEGVKAEFDAMLLPVLLELLLLQPADVQLARHVLSLAAAVGGTQPKYSSLHLSCGGEAWQAVLPVLLGQVGPQVLKLLGSSSSSSNRELEEDAKQELQMALSRLVVLLLEPGEAVPQSFICA
jgi:hypothetical protein